MPDALHQFRTALVSHGIIPPDEIIADGRIHVCDGEGAGGKGDARYMLHLDGIPAGGFQDWRNGGWQSWRADIARKLTPTEEAAHKTRIEVARKEREAEDARRRQEAREQAALIWANTYSCDSHEYLTRKGVQPYGVKTIHTDNARRDAPNLSDALHGLLLVVPMRDQSGALHSLQFITTDGIKRPLTGGKKQGCYYSIGKPDGLLCIAEGFATAASIHEAAGFAVACAFDCGNLLPVAKALREKLPDVKIVLCADDDHATEGNPGITKAMEAAAAVGGVVAVPDFGSDRATTMTDFNDLHQAQGLDAVKRCIEAALSEGTEEPVTACNYGGGRFEVSGRGVFFTGKDSEGNDKPPVWVMSEVRVLAKTRDAKSSEWGRLLEWRDSDGMRHQWALPLEMLQGDGLSVRQELARHGLHITPAKHGRDLVSAYIQVWPVEARARCVERLGWNGAVFVTPSETIGAADELVVFQNASAVEPAFSTAGTLEEWRGSVGSLSAGNSRIVFALSVAFAGALAELAGEDSGGFHFRGASSSGKTTALCVAASVWGNPGRYTRLWRATSNGLEGLAAVHNDGLLILDELSQIDPREAGESAYLLANGQGKTRASRTGAARQSARWWLLFLSAGEESLTALMARAGRKPNAGQEIRLADIESDAGAGLGAFEELHGIANPAAFALALKDAATRSHGAAGAQWLRHVVEHRAAIVEKIGENIRAFVSENVPDGAGGQVVRVARRFGLVAVAGELATFFGITGWREGEADTAARKCFAVWLDGFGGAGNREERAMLEQVRAFFELHGASRFQLWNETGGGFVVSRAGFVKRIEGVPPEYYVFPEAFKSEVCRGFDPKAVARVLLKAGWIDSGTDGKSSQPRSLPGIAKTRCYVFNGRMWEGESCA